MVDHGADPSGRNPNFHTILEKCWAIVQQRGHGIIYAPSGRYTFGGTAHLVGDKGELVGDGGLTRQTVFRHAIVGGVCIRLGENGTGQSERNRFRSFSFDGTYNNSKLIAFNLKNTQFTHCEDIEYNRVGRAMICGADAPGQNNVLDTYHTNCRGTLADRDAGLKEAPAMFGLYSGAIFKISGGPRWDGRRAGGALISHEDSAHNWDGVELPGVVTDSWRYVVRSIGRGISNLQASSMIVGNGLNCAFSAEAAKGGRDFQWLITDNNIASNPDGSGDSVPHACAIKFGTGAGEAFGLTVGNCQIFWVGGPAIETGIAAEGCVVSGNNFMACAQHNKNIIEFGARSGFVGNNHSFAFRSRGRPQYGIFWKGGHSAGRTVGVNSFSDVLAGLEDGSM